MNPIGDNPSVTRKTCQCLLVALRLPRRARGYERSVLATRLTSEKNLLDRHRKAIGEDNYAATFKMCTLAYQILGDDKECRDYLATGRYPVPSHDCAACIATIKRVAEIIDIEQHKDIMSKKRGKGTRTATSSASSPQDATSSTEAAAATGGARGPTAATTTGASSPTGAISQQPVSQQSPQVSCTRDATLATETILPAAPASPISPRHDDQDPGSTSSPVAVHSTPESPVARPTSSAPPLYYQRQLLRMLSHKKQKSRDGTTSKMVIKCLWGPYDVQRGEDAEWLLQYHPRELANYVEFLRTERPQGYRGFIGNVENILDRLAAALAASNDQIGGHANEQQH